jgi:hypothetical protein
VGYCWPSGEGMSCFYEGHTYFERNMGEAKIYILVGTLLG